MITLSVNGERREFVNPLSIAELIEGLELTGKKLAVERNGEIVPRSRFRDEWLSDGDKLEIVVAVGGG
jgi:sulfur carrier protein